MRGRRLKCQLEQRRRGADQVALVAAFAYDTADGESATLYFAGNDGEGLFQIGLPIAVDEDCWNSGDDPTDHAKCDSSSATLTRVADAAKAESNDGMNCPVVWTISETYAPTPEPIQCPDARSLDGHERGRVGLRRLLLAGAGHEGRG